MAKTNAAYSKKAAFIGKKVVIAVKSGGDDPSTNLALAAIMREANALNVPKDVIDRNIKKAMDPVTADYKEMTYEAYGAGGVGLIINCLSDNSNRVTADVTSTVNKAGLKMASSGSVLFNFNRKGRLALQKELRQVSTSLETPPLFAPHFSRPTFRAMYSPACRTRASCPRRARPILPPHFSEDEMLEFAIEAELEGDCELEAPDPDGRNDDDKVKSLPLVSLAFFSMRSPLAHMSHPVCQVSPASLSRLFFP